MPTNLEIALEGIDPVKRLLAEVKHQMPYAQMLALNRTMFLTRSYVQERMEKELDRPTPFTTRGVLYEKATKERLQSRVYLKDEGPKSGGSVAQYMRVQIEGGPRGQKRSEKALRYAGIIGANEYLVPSKTMRLNVYGNIPGSHYSKMISDVGAATADANTSRLKRQYFYATIKGTRGIWYRTGKRGVSLAWLIVSKAPSYRRRFDWEGIARKGEATFLPQELDKAIDQALATADKASR